MFILPGQLPSARSSGGGSEESPSRQFPARLGRQAADTAYSAAGASSGNRPQTQRRNSSSYTFAGNQPLVSLPEINLLHICRFLQEVPPPDFTEPHSTALGGFRTSDRNSTSCNFAAFCNRLVLLESKTMRPATFWRLFLAGGAISGSKHRDLPRFGGFFWQVVPFRGPNAGTCHNFPPFSGRCALPGAIMPWLPGGRTHF